MFRLTFKNLWAHKLRFVLTSLAVVLGVAFMAGTMVLTDTMSKSFDELFASANSGVDVLVQQPAAPGADAHGPRERVPSSVIDQIRSVDGVDAAAGTISGLAQIVQPDGTVAKSGGLGATIGMNWVEEHRLNPLTLASGHSPRGPDEVVIDKNTVDRDHRQIGDRVTIITPAGNREVTLVGTATFGALDGMPGSTLVAFDDATAQTLFAQSDSFDAIAVATRPGTTQADVAHRIDTALGTKTYDVVTGEADTANKQEQFRKDISFFHTFLLAFAYVSLFVAVFIISNTFSITVAQRTKDMAMLRAIGARRRQIIGSVVLESTIVGLLSGVIGLFAGIGMSFGLKAMLDAIGIQIPNGPIVLSTATIVTALTVGLVVTVTSALLPALRAGRIAPIAALRDSILDASGSSKSRTIAGAAITVIGLVLFGAGVTAPAMMQVGLGAAVTIVGVFVLGPILARPFASIAGAPVAAVSGIAGGLARENAKRSPKRTAATASALMIGVALVAFMTILAASMKTSVSDAVDHSFRADYVVAGPDTSDYGTLSPTIEDELRTHPQIGTFSPVRTTTATVADTSTGAPSATKVDSVDTKTFDQLYDLGITAGSLTEVHDGGIAIKKSDAEAQHKAVGDPITVTFARSGSVTFTVRAIFDQGVSGSSASYLVDLGDYQANVTDQMDRQIYVKAAAGTDRSATRTALDAVVASYPNATVQDQSEFKAAVTTQIDQMLNLIYGLLALAVIIALIGIANTLALSVHERTRELGLLRAVGMSRRQVRSAVRWESILIALFGTAVGTLIAIGGAWGMVKAAAQTGASAFVAPVPQLAIIAAIAVLAGMAAAVGPARRAAGMNVLEAISQS